MYDKFEMVKSMLAVFGTMAMVSGFTAVVVHHHDQNTSAWEIAHIERQARLEIARIEGQQRIAEQRWKYEMMRYKHQLARSKYYEPYQAAKEEEKKESGGTGGPQKEEEKD